eukprot:3827129-Rhodomonas_salina.3
MPGAVCVCRSEASAVCSECVLRKKAWLGQLRPCAVAKGASALLLLLAHSQTPAALPLLQRLHQAWFLFCEAITRASRGAHRDGARDHAWSRWNTRSLPAACDPLAAAGPGEASTPSVPSLPPPLLSSSSPPLLLLSSPAPRQLSRECSTPSTLHPPALLAHMMVMSAVCCVWRWGSVTRPCSPSTRAHTASSGATHARDKD